MINRDNLKTSKIKQSAFIVFPSLVFVLLLILLALFMMRGVTLSEKMSGNTREKSRAVESAQAALSYAEWWLQQNENASEGVGNLCTGISAGPKVLPSTCARPNLTDIQTNSALPAYSSYGLYPAGVWMVAPGMPHISSNGGLNSYFRNPRYSIYFAGKDATGRSLYHIFSMGWGGNRNAIAVLHSLYYIQPTLISLGND